MKNDFYRRMGIVCRAVPSGRVASYGQVAMLCGFPNHARQVGFGLRRNLAGNVPAHRIVNSRGELSGAHSFEMPDLQKNLLESEGVQLEWNGKFWRVDLGAYGWKTSIADAQALAAQFEAAEQN